VRQVAWTLAAGALSAALLLPAPTRAQPAAPAASPEAIPSPVADERLRRVRDRKQSLEREVARLRGQEKSLLGDVERLDLEVRLRQEQLRETQLVLNRTNDELDATVRRLRGLEASVAQARPALAARARALYKLGELSYMRMLLSVERPADMLRGYRFVSALARRDRERMAALRSDLAALTTTRRDLEQRTRQALALRSDLERTRRTLEADRSRKSELLTSLVEKKEIQATYLEELEQAEKRLTAFLSGLAQGDATVPITAFKGSLPWPAPGRVRTAFGRHKHPRFDTYTLHNGIDVEATSDTPVTAVHEGTVAFAEAFLGYGLMVIVDHGGKNHTLYARLAEVRVRPGQRVAAGEVLGTVGASAVEGTGLYFEFRAQGRPQDPLEWLTRDPARGDGAGGGKGR
jgi:septal ring factor EnvC (AmiA/AmiB activator)